MLFLLLNPRTPCRKGRREY
uniref:Uncharacterized protein n=1 Tax=Arundo donax TaxID=35708 RepID=A0A0A8YMP8_ARUDO